jgi:diaminohydroxyphosphoribosylaminopyrimidine deaminase/5-amino-6-(5-phosphoribosylamino)uracil reductase
MEDSTLSDHGTWMARCLELAALGATTVAPNPMVGAVLVSQGRILAEGWHQRPGEGHAEVRCLADLNGAPVPADAVLYVNLEPCSHHGRTPPCADLLIHREVRHLVIAHTDPFPEVAGRGVDRLRQAGIAVTTGVLQQQARWLNRRFLTSVEEQRPFIVLKWARSRDGLLDRHPREERRVQRISGPASDVLVHRWRSEEQAILVGSNTALQDNPQLTVRLVQGPSPLRIILDRHGLVPSRSKVFDQTAPTLLFTTDRRNDVSVEQHLLSPDDDPIDEVLRVLHSRQIRSLLVEGGAQLLRHFLERGLWDEARVITGNVLLGQGTPAPLPIGKPWRTMHSGEDVIDHYVNYATGRIDPPTLSNA